MNRVIADLRIGAPVLLHDEEDAALIVAVESLDEDGLNRATELAGTEPSLVLTRRRAQVLALNLPSDAAPVVIVHLPEGAPAELLQEFADPTSGRRIGAPPVGLAAIRPGPLAEAAIELAKLARLLPAMAYYPLTFARLRSVYAGDTVIDIDTTTVLQHRSVLAKTLRRVTDAAVPLADAERARIIAFRPDDGGTDHLAIVIGTPDESRPILVRVHSECFTGDLLGSLRCECGEQLRGAVKAIAEAGGGVLVYLAQEGRGIGLVNKLRAYRLQDAGFDTIEANEQLGFEADERVYQPAAEMLRQLGYSHVRLLTNNPEKVAALARFGIEVLERVPHAFAPNPHNARYLETKAARSGHLF
jgi:GTP cyclohydrolase II